MNNSSPLLAFIVGHSRGATTWMSKCLGKHPDVALFGKVSYLGRKFVSPVTTENILGNRLRKFGTAQKSKG